eukprot:6094595-Pyramimonas_sp.AAC.1
MGNAMSMHAQVLGLQIISHADRRGCCLGVSDIDDHRVVKALEGVANHRRRFWTHRPGHPRHEKKVEHLLRCVDRIKCLTEVNDTRFDAEEILDVDVDA